MVPDQPPERDEDKSNLDHTKKNKKFINVISAPHLCKPLQNDVFNGSKHAYDHQGGNPLLREKDGF